MTLFVVLGAVLVVACLSGILVVRSVKAAVVQEGSPQCFTDQFAALVQASGLPLRDIKGKTGVPVATIDGWKRGKNLPQHDDQLMKVVKTCREAARERNPDEPVVGLEDSDWATLLDEARKARDRKRSPSAGPGAPLRTVGGPVGQGSESPGTRAIIDGLLRENSFWGWIFRLSVAGVLAVTVLIIIEPRPQPASVRIISPDSIIDCPASAPQCQFQVTGHAISASGNQIIVLVYPVNPSGGGWFVQWPPANIQTNGDWVQSPADIGSQNAAADNGDTLRVEAVLVPAGATYSGTSLEKLSASGSRIADVRQITGLVTQSDPVQIIVKTP